MTNTAMVPLFQSPEKNTDWISVFVIPTETQSLWGTIKAAQIRAYRDIKKEKDGNQERRKGMPAVIAASL